MLDHTNLVQLKRSLDACRHTMSYSVTTEAYAQFFTNLNKHSKWDSSYIAAPEDKLPPIDTRVATALAALLMLSPFIFLAAKVSHVM